MKRELARLLTTLLSKHIDENTGGMCMSNLECETMEDCFARGDFDQIDIYLRKKLQRESEDEKIREIIRDVFENHYHNFIWKDGIKTSDVLDWLEKQKDSIPYEKYVEDIAAINAEAKTKYSAGWNDGYEEKQKEQKPAEWGEEDEDIKPSVLKDIISHLYDEGFAGWCQTLKLLLPRLEFMPSEEQMTAFRSYIQDFQEKAEAAVGGWNNYDVMIRLFDQLKKLMEDKK